MAKRRRVYGVIQFPWAIPVTNECLNRTYETRIAGEALQITFPALTPSNELTAPEIPNHPMSKILNKALHRGWGVPLFLGEDETWAVHSARVSFLLTTGKPAVDSPEFASFRRSFAKWFEIVRYWISGWTGELPNDLSHEPDIRINIPNGPKHMWGTGITLRAHVNFEARSATPEEVSSAFLYAGRGEHVPPENRLTMDALHALIVEDFRRSVIDSATAAEVAMAKKVSEILSDRAVTEEAIANIILSANGAVGLFSLLKSLDTVPPVSKNQITEKLAKLRNRTAHAGHTPSRVEASEACECARKIVDALYPLPTTQ